MLVPTLISADATTYVDCVASNAFAACKDILIVCPSHPNALIEPLNSSVHQKYLEEYPCTEVSYSDMRKFIQRLYAEYSTGGMSVTDYFLTCSDYGLSWAGTGFEANNEVICRDISYTLSTSGALSPIAIGSEITQNSNLSIKISSLESENFFLKFVSPFLISLLASLAAYILIYNKSTKKMMILIYILIVFLLAYSVTVIVPNFFYSS